MHLFLLLLIPLMVAFGFFLWSTHIGGKYKISLYEFMLQIVAVCLLMTAGYYATRYTSTVDYEVWNAQVSDKKRVKVSCSHSYSCNCRSYSCGKSTCTHCDTCYDHSYDVNWVVYTTANEQFKINRIDRQGLGEPPRWTQVGIGDPTTLEHSYTNYIKANPSSLLNRFNETPQYPIPSYPIGIYDYHYLDRFIADRVVLDGRFWNNDLQILNSSLGVNKQVNIIVVVTKYPESFSHDLQNKWLGGKKNDVVIIIGSAYDTKIDWVRIVSWSHSELMKVELRDDIIAIGDLSKRVEIIRAIKTRVELGFIRTSMKDFEYIMAGVEPSTTAMIVLGVLGLMMSIGLSWWFYHEDIFNNGRY